MPVGGTLFWERSGVFPRPVSMSCAGNLLLWGTACVIIAYGTA